MKNPINAIKGIYRKITNAELIAELQSDVEELIEAYKHQQDLNAELQKQIDNIGYEVDDKITDAIADCDIEMQVNEAVEREVADFNPKYHLEAAVEDFDFSDAVNYYLQSACVSIEVS